MSAANQDARSGNLRHNHHVEDDDEQMVSMTFSKSDWGLMQEALDNEYYETEHWEPRGLTKDRRVRNRQHREARMDRLKHLDEVIGQETGLGPL